jgi:two-component system sensor histidine kinase UhpB
MAVSHESERAEAVTNLAALLGLGAVGSVALLLAMGWNVHRSFVPMRSLLRAIAALRDDDAQALRALPSMPIGELQSIAGALRELADALEAAERQRRALSAQVLTLQEDERQRIARELHDEFGQRLTALRADAAWLARRIGQDAQAQGVVDTMAAQCEALQHEIRSLLTRLSPAGASDGAADLLRLQRLLEGLVQAWNTSPGQTVHFALALEARAADDRAVPWPPPELAQRARVAARVVPRAVPDQSRSIDQRGAARPRVEGDAAAHAAARRRRRFAAVAGQRRRRGTRLAAGGAAARQWAGGHPAARLGAGLRPRMRAGARRCPGSHRGVPARALSHAGRRAIAREPCCRCGLRPTPRSACC